VALVALAAVTAGIGCGGGGSDRDARVTTATTPAGTPTIQHPNRLSKDTSRTAADVPPDRLACDLLTAGEVAKATAAVTHRTPRLQAHRSDSYQLSVCLYSGRGGLVRVSLDGASDATRRYYNMSTEAAEIPKLLGRRKNFLLVQNDGDDDTYGGAGAYWQRTSTGSSRSTTTASSASRPRSRARPTASDALASLLARRVFARLDG
jgi:hypothetical protein